MSLATNAFLNFPFCLFFSNRRSRSTRRAGKKRKVDTMIVRRPTPVTMPSSFIPRELLMLKVRNAMLVVTPPVKMPLPLLRKVFCMAASIVFPNERPSVNPEIIWIEKSIPNPIRITVIM